MILIFLRVIRALILLATVFPYNGLTGAVKSVAYFRVDTENRESPLSWNEYWKQVEDTRRIILECEQIPPEQAHAQLEGLVIQWEAITSVVLPDGREMAVDQSYLISLLRMTSPDLVRIDHLLAVMLAERDTLGQGQFTADDLASLSRILARPEFQWKDQNNQPNVLQKLWQRIQQELSNLGQKFFGFKGVNYVLGIGAVLLLAATLLFLFRNLLFGFVAEAQLAPRARAGSEVLTADTALKRAQDLSGSGDYRSAVRYLYLSALMLLEERGLLRYDRTKTNREYLRSVSGYPELETSLRFVVEVFDRVWYGYQPLEDRDYQFYERQVGKLRQQRQITQPKSDGE
jgi:hypothetical protein